ncbi:MAG: T9SS type A sorting domain-containing protein [Bacteroidetes bacterium]|nr:MAG: T9SS type A sorting domain-containing protein [Bacteroidota bacterium]
MNMKKFTLILSFLGLSSLAFAQPAAPTLSTPADLATDIAVLPTFTWDTAGTEVDSFVLMVGTAANLSNADSFFVGNGASTYQLTNALSVATVYYWSVASIDSNGVWGMPANAFSFTTITPPASPDLVSPATGSLYIDKNPLLEWTAVAGATSYRVHIAAFNNFGDTVYHAVTNNTTHSVTKTLDEYTVYYWRVLAENQNGLSEWSYFWNFTTVLTGIAKIEKGNFDMNMYPNPTDANTNLSFNLNQGGNARISVLDLSGKEVMVVHNGKLNAGAQNFSIAAAGLNSGVYFVQVNVDGVAQMMKLAIR